MARKMDQSESLVIPNISSNMNDSGFQSMSLIAEQPKMIAEPGSVLLGVSAMDSKFESNSLNFSNVESRGNAATKVSTTAKKNSASPNKSAQPIEQSVS